MMAKKRKVFRNEYNWHHRKPKKLRGSGNIDGPNMVHVPIVQHRAWHTLFGTKTPAEIAIILNETWLDPEWFMIAVRRNQDGEGTL